MKTEHDYEINWNDPVLQKLEFWGLFYNRGRIEVNIEEYKAACESIGISDFIPEGLLKKKISQLFIPAKKCRHDYIVNIFDDLLNEFAMDWNNEYKPIFKMIKSPKEVYDETRVNALMYTSDPDDLDDIEFGALMSSIKRQEKYSNVIKSLYCQFITKLTTEIDRITLIAMCKLGYKGNNYDFKSFVKFSEGLSVDESGLKISSLEKYNAYNMLHKINNFLKHNTVSSYMDLKKHYPANVASVENGTANCEYENGMFAGDWIIIKDGYIDSMINKLKKFFKGYCEIFVGENIEEAKWNYDDYFIDAYNALKNPARYLGI